MISSIHLPIAPITRAPRQGKLICLEWACEREGLSFPEVLAFLQQQPDTLVIYQDAIGGAMLVGSAQIADFAVKLRHISLLHQTDKCIVGDITAAEFF